MVCEHSGLTIRLKPCVRPASEHCSRNRPRLTRAKVSGAASNLIKRRIFKRRRFDSFALSVVEDLFESEQVEVINQPRLHQHHSPADPEQALQNGAPVWISYVPDNTLHGMPFPKEQQ